MGKYSSPLLFSEFFRVALGFFTITCNLGKQNWASMNKIIILVGGDGCRIDFLLLHGTSAVSGSLRNSLSTDL